MYTQGKCCITPRHSNQKYLSGSFERLPPEGDSRLPIKLTKGYAVYQHKGAQAVNLVQKLQPARDFRLLLAHDESVSSS